MVLKFGVWLYIWVGLKSGLFKAKQKLKEREGGRVRRKQTGKTRTEKGTTMTKEKKQTEKRRRRKSEREQSQSLAGCRRCSAGVAGLPLTGSPLCQEAPVPALFLGLHSGKSILPATRLATGTFTELGALGLASLWDIFRAAEAPPGSSAGLTSARRVLVLPSLGSGLQSSTTCLINHAIFTR